MANIIHIPVWDRPYEKMMLYGEESLSESELLSIIIKNGTKNLNALQIAQNIISKNVNIYSDFRFLQQISINELIKFEGIGKIKAIELKAVGEIAKRIEKPINEEKLFITSRKDIVELFMQQLRYEKTEILKLVMLNNKNRIQKIETIAKGSSDGITFDIKQVLSEPIKMQIPKIIVLHNHPSGVPEPSLADIEFTKRLDKACLLLGIELLDHIIIGDGIFQNIDWKG